MKRARRPGSAGVPPPARITYQSCVGHQQAGTPALPGRRARSTLLLRLCLPMIGSMHTVRPIIIEAVVFMVLPLVRCVLRGTRARSTVW